MYFFINNQNMITKEECEQLIANQYIQNESLRNNTSNLMTKAWWGQRQQCLSYFWDIWPIAELNKFLESIDISTWSNGTQSHNAASLIQETGQVQPIVPWNAKTKIWNVFHIIWLIFLIFILWLLLWKIIQRCFRRWYAFVNHNRMIYMKVLLPRWDSKTDREQAKEIAKDMKEKIWRMSQVYTNLKKLWKLNWKDKLMYKFFRKPRISLMYHYVDWVLNFIIWCYPEYKTLIEWSIWAQYPDSSIEIVNEPNMFKRKHYKIMPLQTEKDDVYTLKLYKKLSDDPINNIIDAIWNISKYDTATIMLNIKPLWDSRNSQAKKKNR